MNKATQSVAQALATPGLFAGWLAEQKGTFDELSVQDCALGSFLWIKADVVQVQVVSGFCIKGFIERDEFKTPIVTEHGHRIYQDSVNFYAADWPQWLTDYLSYWDEQTVDQPGPYFVTRASDYVEILERITAKEAIAA